MRAIALGVLLLVPPALTSASAEVSTVLLREGQPSETDSLITKIRDVRVNHTGGFAASVRWDGPLGSEVGFWGSVHGEPATWITPAGLVRETASDWFGFGDTGEICYQQTIAPDPSSTIWLDGIRVFNIGDPGPGGDWLSGGRAGIVAGTGQPVWQGRVDPTFQPTSCGAGANGFYVGVPPAALTLGGRSVPDVPVPLACDTAQWGTVSRFGNHSIVLCTINFPSDYVMVVDGAGLVLGGSLVREYTAVPVSIGGDGVEQWGSIFQDRVINEAGDYLFTNIVHPYPTGDQLVVRNGIILYREGSVVDGETLAGNLPSGGLALNEDGDFALLWTVEDSGTLPVVILNDRIVARAGDPVDLDGDGAADAGVTLRLFDPAVIGSQSPRIHRVRLTERHPDGSVTLYFVADVDTAGTPIPDDDVECLVSLEVPGPATSADPAAGARTTSLEPNRPNPFRDRTAIRFSLERPSQVRLTVFDVAGRRVTALLDSRLPAGAHSIDWDGRGQGDRPLPGGVYVLRLETPDWTETIKMTRLGIE